MARTKKSKTTSKDATSATKPKKSRSKSKNHPIEQEEFVNPLSISDLQNSGTRSKRSKTRLPSSDEDEDMLNTPPRDDEEFPFPEEHHSIHSNKRGNNHYEMAPITVHEPFQLR